MNDLNCPACGGTLGAEPYRALDASRWCQHCADDAREEQRTNYAPENEAGLVDAHAAVLDLLRTWQEEGV